MRWFIGILLVLAVALVIQSGLLAYAAYVLLGVLLLWGNEPPHTGPLKRSLNPRGSDVPVLSFMFQKSGCRPSNSVFVQTDQMP